MLIGKVIIDEGTENISEFKRVSGKYERQLKDELKTTLAGNHKEWMEAEINMLLAEHNELKQAKEDATEELEVLKLQFTKEADEPENKNKRGQNVRAGMEEILKDYGIERREQQHGDVQGNVCQRLMSDSNNILREITNFL